MGFATRARHPGREERRRSRLEQPAAMSRPALEVADIFRDHGAAWRRANAGHVSLDQMKVMSAIERCRTAARAGALAPVPAAVSSNAQRRAGRLKFQGNQAGLADQAAFAVFLAALRKTAWVAYAKEPFGGPKGVLAYLSRYTHRVAISNRRLVAANEKGITFKWKDHRIAGPGRYKTMTLPTHEFIRRFLIHVLPKGLHRIRQYGLFANCKRSSNIALARELLAMPPRVTQPEADAPSKPNQPRMLPTPCPSCGGRMIIIEVFARGCEPKHRPKLTVPAIRIDTS